MCIRDRGQDYITNNFRSLWLIASTLIIFGLILGFADRIGKKEKDLATLNARDGVLSTGAAFVAFFTLAKIIGVARGSLVTYLNTACAVLLGVIILKEPLTVGIILGLPLVLIGSYFASRKPENVSVQS